MFDDLPDGCVAHVIGLLHSVKDVLNFAASCTRNLEIAKALRTKWLQLLHKDFDTRLHVDVDHMFTPNHWSAYCSEYGSNINCVGLLLGDGDIMDKKWAAMRSYIIQRCSTPVSRLFAGANPEQVPLGDPIPEHLRVFSEELQHYLQLAAWSTQALTALFLNLFAEMQQGTALGHLMLQGLETVDELNQLRGTAIYLQQSYLAKCHVLTGGQGAEHVLLDSYALKLMKKAAHLPQLVGVVESVSICRAGEFTCPLRCGVLFMADCNHPQWSQEEGSSIIQAFQACVGQQVCRELDDVDTPQALHYKIKEGRLPAAIAAHLTPQGGWVEFHPSSHPQPDSRDPSDPTTGLAIPMLRPLAWFRLTTAAEQELLQQRVADGEALHQIDEAPWWQDLVEPGVREHWRGAQGAEESFVHSPLDETEIGNPATAASRLNIRLHHRHSGNMLCIKLIDQENLMAERHDNHPNPNIDVNFIACHGRLLELPEQVHLDWA